MFVLLILILLCPCAHLEAVLVHGVACTSPANTAVKLLGIRHACDEVTRDQQRIKEHITLIDEYVATQPRQNLVMLAEEPSWEIAVMWRICKKAAICNDMRSVAEKYGMMYENIDLRSASLAASYALSRTLEHKTIESWFFGAQGQPQSNSDTVTLDNLFAETERYKQVMHWSPKQEKKVNKIYNTFREVINGFDPDTPVVEVCKQASPDIIGRLSCVNSNLSSYMFDQYAQRKVEISSQERPVVLVAGAWHVESVDQALRASGGWTNLRPHREEPGQALTAYQIKSVLETLSWKEYFLNWWHREVY